SLGWSTRCCTSPALSLRPRSRGRCLPAHGYPLPRHSGEIDVDVFEALAARDAEAKAGITLLPGVGFDVVPPDCLTALLKRRLPLRRHGRIIAPPRPKAADCALVNGQQPTIVILWGDVSTAYYSTKIGNIEVRVAARGPCELRPSCQIVPRR